MNDCTTERSGAKLEGVIRVDEQEIESHVGEVVRQSVEETLNGLLEAELAGPVHALALHTMTPQEWFAKGGEAPQSPPCLGGGKS